LRTTFSNRERGELAEIIGIAHQAGTVTQQTIVSVLHVQLDNAHDENGNLFKTVLGRAFYKSRNIDY
jgi:hypothetical protein